MPLSFLFPLAAAVIYATAALLLKRSAELGVGVWRTAFVANVVSGVLFQPLLLLGGTWQPHLWWQPALAALCFVTGQWLTFVSLERGDVSVATPVLGIKILLVAVLVTVLGGTALRWQLWAAACLATAGIAFLNRGGGVRHAHHDVGRTIVTAGLAAAAYALFDVLVQKWAPAWGLGRFVPATLALSAIFSVGFVPRFHAPLLTLPRKSWAWLLAGTAMLATQSLIFVSAIVTWGQAATANVIYASRGLWTVLLVWAFGHWVQSREQQLGGRVLGWRLAGAILMMAAIVLVLV